MANPEAVSRMAQAGPEPMPPAPPSGPPTPAPDSGGGGLETLVQDLDKVGKFLQSKGPAAQKAMAAFQALLQELGQIGGEDAPEGAMNGESSPAGPPGAVHESRKPGVQVL